ncbi:MAG: DUF1801 domain-containing protein [Corynebacterium sp.]|nr:DUF1801 domain-containing protein [Corynebacterium sp.]
MSISKIHRDWLEKELAGDARHDYVEGVMAWVSDNFPDLESVVKWNSPMWTKDGTFILGLSYASKHISIAPEAPTMEHFHERLVELGYKPTSQLFRIPIGQEPDWDLLRAIIERNIFEKSGHVKFWR